MQAAPSSAARANALVAALADWARTDGKTWIYLFKALVAAMLALGVALKLDLPQPRTAMTTVFVVMQPQSGAVFAKSTYRVIGTLVGLVVMLALIGLFAQQPELFIVSTALWIGLCTTGAARNRNFRSYGFVLAGYTAAMIGLPASQVPGTAFMTSLTRVAEIVVGILCSGFVSAVIFPEYAGQQIRTSVRRRFSSFIGYASSALAGRLDRRQLEAISARFIADIVGFEATRSIAIFEDPDVRMRGGRLARLNSEFMTASTRFHALYQLMNRLRSASSQATTGALEPYFREVAGLLDSGGESVLNATDAARMSEQLHAYQTALPRRIRATRAQLQAQILGEAGETTGEPGATGEAAGKPLDGTGGTGATGAMAGTGAVSGTGATGGMGETNGTGKAPEPGSKAAQVARTTSASKASDRQESVQKDARENARASERTTSQTNERTGEQTGQPNERTSERANEQTNERAGEQTDKRTSERAGEQTTRQPDERASERANEQPAKQAGKQANEQATEQANRQAGEQRGGQRDAPPREQQGAPLLDFDTASELLYRFLHELHEYTATYASLAVDQHERERWVERYQPKTSWAFAFIAGGRAAVVTMLLGAFWIVSAWPSGTILVLNAAATCALASSMPNPIRMAMQMMVGTALAVFVGMIVTFEVFPHIDGFVMLCTVLVPVLAFGVFLTTRPKYAGYGIGYCIFFCFLAGPDNTMHYDPGSFMNDAIALILSSVVSAIAFATLLPSSARWLKTHLIGSLRRQVVHACHARLQLPRLRNRFESGTRDLMSQIDVLASQETTLRSESRHWLFAVLEVGNATIDLRGELATLPAHPRYGERMPWRAAIRAMLGALGALFARPGAARYARAIAATGAATAAAQQQLTFELPREERHQLQRILSHLHFIRTALLNPQSPFKTYDATRHGTPPAHPAQPAQPTQPGAPHAP